MVWPDVIIGLHKSPRESMWQITAMADFAERLAPDQEWLMNPVLDSV